MAHDNTNQAREATRQHEMLLQRITAEYIGAYERGEHPAIEDYLRQYPAYASEFLDFALFYQSYVAGVLEPRPRPEPTLDANASAAIRRIRETRRAAQPMPRIAEAAAAMPYAGTPRGPIRQIKGIVAEGIARRLPPTTLAAMVRVTPDVLAKLDAHAIAAASIPSGFLRELANALKVPVGSIHAYLSGATGAQAGFYFAETAPKQGQETFLKAIEASALPSEQKLAWRDDVEREGLAE